MIFIDIDGVLVDFYGTAKKFGIELEINRHGDWKWGEPPYPAPEEFYVKAELQPWAKRIASIAEEKSFNFLTRDYAKIKKKFICEKLTFVGDFCGFLQEPVKSKYCENPIDLLIDDNPAECEAWRNKGGMAYWFDLASKTPFEDFLKWWRMEK